MRRSRALGVSSEGAPELEPIPLSNEGGANRFILQSARGGEPPSASPTTLQAMGRVFVKDARRRASGKDPEYSAEQKWAIARTIHAGGLARAAGRVCVVRSLEGIGRRWTHCLLGARFVITRCVACARKTTRGCAEASVGHLPKPFCSGDCAGVDLKTLAPRNGRGANKWVILLAGDFKSREVFARDTDCGKVFDVEAQSRNVGGFARNRDPPAILRSDNGGQFNTVLGQMHLHTIGPPSE